MKKISASLALGVSAMLLAACAGATSVPAGPLKVGGAQVTLGRQWSDISTIMTGRPKKIRLLSIDGPMLNRLYISDGLSPGDFLVKPLAKERPTPLVRANMSVTERMEFVADSVTAMDFQRVEVSKPRPATYGGYPAVRFDLSAKTTEGLDVLGVAEAAEVGGKTYVLLYLAPAEHYYAATLSEVEAIMASAQPQG